MITNHKFTLLAQARHYGVIGSPDGKTLVPAAAWAINCLNKWGHLLNPVRMLAPPLETPQVAGGYRPVVVPDLPPDAIIWMEYRTELLTGIMVYVGFYAGKWYVREIRGTGGQFFTVERGGAEWKTTQAAGV